MLIGCVMKIVRIIFYTVLWLIIRKFIKNEKTQTKCYINSKQDNKKKNQEKITPAGKKETENSPKEEAPLILYEEHKNRLE